MALSFQSKIRPVGTTTQATQPVASGLSFASKIRPVTTQPTTPQGDGVLMGIAKSVLSPVATLAARPVQLAAEFAGATSEQVNQYNLGGFVAPVPQNTSDVVKDVGRGVQTVALGITAPESILTAGGAFGLGSSLEKQGSNITSKEGLTDAFVQTLIGMGGAKLLDFAGRPILNAAGKVIGKWTPQALLDIAKQGTGAVDKFMQDNKFLNAVTKPTAPIAKAITTGAKAIDSTINKSTKALFTGGMDVVKSQYPALKTENIAQHYQDNEINRMMEPTTKGGTRYKVSTEIVKDAERRGIDVAKKMADNKIYASDNITDGVYDTKDTAQALLDETKSHGNEIIRPALREAQAGVPTRSIQEVRGKIIDKIYADGSLTPAQKAKFIRKVNIEYGDFSPEAKTFKNGYNLEDLYNSKLKRVSGVYKTPKGGGVSTISDALTIQQKKIEAEVFNSILKDATPKEVGLDPYFKAQEENFVLSNYLNSLNGKRAPVSLFQRATRRAGQLAGGVLGFKAAGPIGIFSGYQFGGMMNDTFASLPNPLKVKYLLTIPKKTPAIFDLIKQYTAEEAALRGMRPRLGAGTLTDRNLQKVRNASGAIEMGPPAETPANTMGNNITQNSRSLFNTKQLPSPEPRTILPNNQGTPNIFNRPYAPNEQGAVGGFGQKMNQEQFNNYTRQEIVRLNNELQNSRIFKGKTPAIKDAQWTNTSTGEVSKPKLKDIFNAGKEKAAIEKAYYQEKIDAVQTALDNHPGKQLQKFISTKEGEFLDFKNPNLAKTASEKAKIIAKNAKVMKAAETAFSGTQYENSYDNPYVIKQAIEEYKALKDNLDKLKGIF